MSALPPGDLWSLLDWKRRVLDIYAHVRASDEPTEAWERWRQERADLFAHHSQSPLPTQARADWRGLDFFDYDPAARVLAEVRPAAPQSLDVPTSGDETMGLVRFATAAFRLQDAELELGLFWLLGYGGGLFLPFRDTTSGNETYGAGRYLLDTIKGADLGMEGGRLLLDFNFAYNPSCAYDPQWVCPLAPPSNRLEIPVRAGERTPT
jgi:uncharacterized protein (DUF1684 family)